MIAVAIVLLIVLVLIRLWRFAGWWCEMLDRCAEDR